MSNKGDSNQQYYEEKRRQEIVRREEIEREKIQHRRLLNLWNDWMKNSAYVNEK